MKIRKFYMIEGEIPTSGEVFPPEMIPEVIKGALTFDPRGFESVEVTEVRPSPFKVHQIEKVAKEKPQGNDENKEAGSSDSQPS